MPSPCALDEDDALELLAFLVTAARTQADSAAPGTQRGVLSRLVGRVRGALCDGADEV